MDTQSVEAAATQPLELSNGNRQLTCEPTSAVLIELEQSYQRQLPELLEQANANNSPDWTIPASFGGGPIFFDDVILPEVGCEFLPTWINNYIDAASYQYQVPIGTATMLSLAVLAACIQKQFIVSPYNDNSYIVPLNIWTLVLTDSRQKRAILDALLKPITNKEQLFIEEAKLNIDNELMHDFYKAQVRCLINKAARTEVEALTEPRNWETGSKHETAEDLVRKAAEVKGEMPSPIKWSKMIITNDITKKNLQLKLAEHSGKLAIVSDDGTLLKCMSSPDFLHGYSGGELRVKIKDKYIDLNNIAITAGLIVPPEALRELKTKTCPYVKELASNFLYYIPDSNVGRGNLRNREAVPEDARLGYEAGMELMLNLRIPGSFDKNTGKHLPKIIRLSDEALESLHQFSEELYSEVGKGDQFEAMHGWVENLPDTALRIAGLVHIIKLVDQYLELIISLPEEQQCELMSYTLSPLSPISDTNLENNLVINKETMEKVIALCKKLITHAQMTYDLLEIDKTNADVKYILDWIYKHSEVDDNGAIFIRQRKLCRSSHFSPTRLLKALNQLNKQNILRLVLLATRKPTYVWYVNPEIFKCKVKEKFNSIGQSSKLLAYAS